MGGVWFFAGDVPEKAAIIFGMGRGGQSQGFFGGVRDEQFFAGNADALVAVARVNLRRARLQPSGVTIESLALHPRFGKLLGVSHLFHHQRDLLIFHLEILLRYSLLSRSLYLPPAIESKRPLKTVAVPQAQFAGERCLFT